MQDTLLAERYRLREAVGVGGMGTVYRAEDVRTGGIVAVKMIHPHLAQNARYTARLQREARIAASIDSPRVVRVTDLGHHEGVPFIVMEYVGGRTLHEELQVRGRLAVAEALGITLQVARALEAAHMRAVTHCDLNPQNIKLVDEQVKVLDFGIARAADDASSYASTGPILGTPAYIAPEQVAGRGDIRTDIYALGVILFELLEGQLPFLGPTALAMVRQHESQPVPPLSVDVPFPVADIIQRCLAKDPDARYQTPSALVDALNTVLERPAAEPVSLDSSVGVDLDPHDRSSFGSTIALPARESIPNNLPSARSAFIGRTREVAEVKRRLMQARLLTLTSTGGCGKTRLALQVSQQLLEQYRDGVWFVGLAPLVEPSLVAQTVASALRIRETPGQPILRGLVEHLRPRHALLVMDNCEHLSSACASLAERLLDECPLLQILATSREVLGVSAEEVFGVPSLGLPEPSASLTSGQTLLDTAISSEAVQLLVSRTRGRAREMVLTNENVEIAVQSCRRLDGIPLALELAAAQVGSVGLAAVAYGLDAHFRRVTGRRLTALPREQTLRVVLDWVYDRLSGDAQVLLRRMAIFAGGLRFDAVAGVCGVDSALPGTIETDLRPALAELVDGLLAWDQPYDGETRWDLDETVRQFGCEKLEAAGEAVEVRDRHRDWYVSLAEHAESELRGRDQELWLARLEREHDNLRTALAWSLQKDDAQMSLRLGAGLWRFWQARGHFTEGRTWLESALDAGGLASDIVRARALNGAGVLVWRQGNYPAAQAHYTDALTLYERLGDKAGVAMANNNLGIVARHQGDYALARALHARSLDIRRELGDEPGILAAVGNLGSVALVQRDYETARRSYEETLALARRRGDKRVIAGTLDNLGIVARHQGDYAAARHLHDECLELGRELGDKWVIAESLANLGTVALVEHDCERASELLLRSLAVFQELGDREGLATCLERLGTVAAVQGERVLAGNLWGAVEAMRTVLETTSETPDPHYERLVTATRGAPDVEQAVLDGASMTVAEAMELATGTR